MPSLVRGRRAVAMRVKCPSCGVQLSCEPGPAGKRIACPSCRHVFFVRPPDEGFTTVEPAPPRMQEEVVDVLPADVEPSGPSRAAHRFAREEGIDPQEMFDRQVEDETAATQLLHEWQKEMPEVPSAYQPSGVLPGNALVMMSMGAVVGGGAGLLAGGVAAALGGAILALIGYFIALLLFCGFIWYFSIFVGVIAVLGGLAATFFFTGWAAAACTTQFGEFGKNRNSRAAATLSVLSSLLAIVFAAVLYFTVGKPMLAEHGWADYSDYIALGVGILGGAFAAFTAAVTAADRVAAAKFCEECERYMEAKTLKKVCLGTLRTLVRALGQQRLDVAASLLHDPAGDDGEVKLFACPSCSQGYVEVTVHFKAEWKEKKDKKEKEKSWLAASRNLPAVEIERFRDNMVDAGQE